MKPTIYLTKSLLIYNKQTIKNLITKLPKNNVSLYTVNLAKTQIKTDNSQQEAIKSGIINDNQQKLNAKTAINNQQSSTNATTANIDYSDANNVIPNPIESPSSIIDISQKKIKVDDSLSDTVLDNQWTEMTYNLKQLPKYYLKLSKQNLTTLVVITTMSGFLMAPGEFILTKFLYTTIGTALTSTSANAINQFLEVPYDSQMKRTSDRVLVRGNLTPLHAFTFATVCGVVGVSMLYYLVNPLTAGLGAANLLLYTTVYTPMKRLSVLNTWVGSIVGAIPPIMGYAAMTNYIDPAALIMGAILYSWQFPHFHALSWNIRNEYSRAGYRMISVLNPRICTSSAFSHTVSLTLLCSLLAPYYELTSWFFAFDSLPFNLYFMYLAYKFKQNHDGNSSRKLFRYSLVYLPLVMMLMFITRHPATDSRQKPNNNILTHVSDSFNVNKIFIE